MSRHELWAGDTIGLEVQSLQQSEAIDNNE